MDGIILPLRQSIFDVVQSTVDKHARIIPGAALDADGLVNLTLLLQVLVSNGDSYVTCYVKPANVKKMQSIHTMLAE